jgi:type IV secretion system protein VirB9
MKRSAAFAVLLLAGCASQPPVPLDNAVQAEPLPEISKPIQIVEVPKLLPLPNQLKRLPVEGNEGIKEPLDAKSRVARANQEARVIPSQEGYINAIQVWPYADGALYQLFTSPGRVTVIALQEGEELVTVSAGDTVRWIVGDTTSGAGATQRVNILVKPTRSGIRTNLVITTSRRTYLLELTATEKAWMASASWEYPKDRMLALQKQASIADAKAPLAQGLSLE